MSRASLPLLLFSVRSQVWEKDMKDEKSAPPQVDPSQEHCIVPRWRGEADSKTQPRWEPPGAHRCAAGWARPADGQLLAGLRRSHDITPREAASRGKTSSVPRARRGSSRPHAVAQSHGCDPADNTEQVFPSFLFRSHSSPRPTRLCS